MKANSNQKSNKKPLIIIGIIVAALALVIGYFVIIHPKIMAQVSNLAETKWKEDPLYQKIEKAYGLNITERGASNSGIYIKLESTSGFNFYFYSKAHLDITSYRFMTEKDGTEYMDIDDILYILNKDKIHALADKYSGTFTKDDNEFRIVAFKTANDRSAFANAVANLDMIKPAAEICKANPDYDKNDKKCDTISPIVSIKNKLYDFSDSYQLGTYADFWNYVSF